MPDLDIYDQDWPIWTDNEVAPPAKFVHDEDGRRGLAISSLVSEGCIVSGASLRRTLLSTGARVNSFANVENAVILPRVDVGRSARLRNVVIDADVKIPEGLIVGEDPELDAKRFRRTERGICLITQSMIDKLANPGSTVLVHALDQRLEEQPINGSVAPEMLTRLGGHNRLSGNDIDLRILSKASLPDVMLIVREIDSGDGLVIAHPQEAFGSAVMRDVRLTRLQSQKRCWSAPR